MKFAQYFFAIGLVASHAITLSMDEQQQYQDEQRRFIHDAFVPGLLHQCGMDSDAFRAWDRNYQDYEQGEERFQFAKKINATYQLGLDAEIQRIERLSGAAVAQHQTTAAEKAIGDDDDDDTTLKTRKNKLKLIYKVWFACSVIDRKRTSAEWNGYFTEVKSAEYVETYFKLANEMNTKYKLGYDKFFPRIQAGESHPFRDLKYYYSTDETDSGSDSSDDDNNSNDSVVSHAITLSMNEQQKQIAINVLKQKIWAAVEKKTVAKVDLMMNYAHNNTAERRLSFLENFNKKYNLGFDSVIEKIKNDASNPFGDPNAQHQTTAAEKAIGDDDDSSSSTGSDDDDDNKPQPLDSSHAFPSTTKITDQDRDNAALTQQKTGNLSALKTISFTEEQKRNAQIPYRSTQYNEEEEADDNSDSDNEQPILANNNIITDNESLLITTVATPPPLALQLLPSQSLNMINRIYVDIIRALITRSLISSIRTSLPIPLSSP